MTCIGNKHSQCPSDLSDERGRKKSVYIVTFGCQMNQHDSEIMGGLLEKAGFGPAKDAESADIILFNTCCVREHAEQRLYSRISQLKNLKKQKPELLVGIGGCVAQKEKAALTKRFPYVDLVFGTHSFTGIVSLLERVRQDGKPIIDTPEDGPNPRTDAAVDSSRERLHAWVSIMRGCDNFCSYCVVPYVRGPQRSKPPEEVVNEARGLAERGVVEITLLGQNVNSYGQDIHPKTTFVRLLQSLNEITTISRIRFTTSHPKDLSTELMFAIRNLERVCEHLHLPVQSGSSRILKLMNRGYSAEEYIRKVEDLRNIVPDIGISTDIIVGFPSETSEDFELTVSLVEQIRFDGAYIFKYSPRPETAAVGLDGKLEPDAIVHRHRKLLELQKKISMDRLTELVGTSQSVLPEKKDLKRPGYLSGRTRTNRIVSLSGAEGLIGKETEVRITGLSGWTLIGNEQKPDSRE